MKVRIGLKEMQMVFNLVPTATVQQLIQAKVSRKDEEEAGARGKSQREAEQSEREAYL